MRYATPKSICELTWICLLALCAGCAIETDEALVETGAGIYPDWAPEPGLFEGPLHEEGQPETAAAPALVLNGASPNPIDSQTRLSFAVNDDGSRVVLAIYGIDGRRIRLLVDERLEEGEYSAFWYARDDAGRAVPSGVYLVSLRKGSDVKLRKVLLVR